MWQDDSIHAQNAPPNRAEMGDESAMSKEKPPNCTTFVVQFVPGLLTTLLSSENTQGIDYGALAKIQNPWRRRRTLPPIFLLELGSYFFVSARTNKRHHHLNRPLRISPGPRHLSRPLAAISTSDNRPGDGGGGDGGVSACVTSSLSEPAPVTTIAQLFAKC